MSKSIAAKRPKGPWHLLFSACLLALLAPGCSKGGEEENPNSGVSLAADFHLVGLRAEEPLNPTLVPFPVEPRSNFRYSDQGVLALDVQNRYTVSRPGTSAQDAGRYGLTEAGILSLLVPGPRGSTVALMGAADPAGEFLWFTDRFLENGNLRGDMGLWAGVLRQADAKLRERWHVALLTLVFAKPGTAASPDQVARATAGSLSIDANGVVSGALEDSSGVPIQAIAGVLGKVRDFPLGSLELDLDWIQGSERTTRTYRGGVGQRCFVAVFESKIQGGAVSLMIGLKAPDAPVEASELNGSYHLGSFTFFADPARPGCEAAAGSLTLNGKDAFSASVGTPFLRDPLRFSGGFTLDQGTPEKFGLVKFDETSPVKIPIWGAALKGGKQLLLLDMHKEASGPDLTIFVANRL